MDLARESDVLFHKMAIEVDGEDTMGTSGGLVEGGRAHLTDEVAHHEEVQSLLFTLYIYNIDIF